MNSTAGKLAVAGNGRGVIVGYLKQYRKRSGFVRMATSRAAWPHALHGKQQQQQQREKSRRDQVWVFRQPVLFLVRQHIAGVGYRSGRHRWGFRRRDDEFVVTMDTPVDPNYFFDRTM